MGDCSWRGVGLAVVVLGVPLLAAAGEVSGARPIRLPAQPLDQALQQLADQSGIQIVYFSKLAEGHEAPALDGNFPPDAALALLLKGTELTFSHLNPMTVEVRAVSPLRRTSAQVGEPVPPAPAPAPKREVAEPEREHGTVEEVIVTARRVRENQQDTPVAITAFSGDALERRQIFQTDQLTQVVPNLQFGSNAPLAGNNSSSQVFIRGIGQTDPTSTVDPGVGLYIDDVDYSSADEHGSPLVFAAIKELQAIYRLQPLTAVVGAYYFKQYSNDIAGVQLNPPTPGIQGDSDNNVVDNKSWTVFTQWTFNITGRLGVTGGARYTQDNKGSYPDQFDYAAPTIKQ
ncbi:MAG TPA: secretin and TonB N-terminal domain-containing protein, partial [Steroidobacteraceae bacterium]